MNCVVCSSAKKYKCSKCAHPYCSVQCYRLHTADCKGKLFREVKREHNLAPLEDPVVKTDYVSDEELRLSQAKLQKLAKSTRVKTLLRDVSLR